MTEGGRLEDIANASKSEARQQKGVSKKLKGAVVMIWEGQADPEVMYCIRENGSS
jgi:hypothetical protein